VVAIPIRGELDFAPPPGQWDDVIGPELAGITVLERA
jgi:hypothetical protein